MIKSCLCPIHHQESYYYQYRTQEAWYYPTLFYHLPPLMITRDCRAFDDRSCICHPPRPSQDILFQIVRAVDHDDTAIAKGMYRE